MLVILPSLTAIFATIILFVCWRKLEVQCWINLIATTIYFIFAVLLFFATWHKGYMIIRAGGWSAPYGISLCVDQLSALMLLLTAIIALAVSIYSLGEMCKADIQAGFYPAFQVLLVGLSGIFITADLFNLYVWFEVILISSFILLVLSGRKFQLEAAVKYAVLNLIATLLLLSAIALLYGMTGTLNLADLALKVQQSQYPGFLQVIAVLFIIAFGMKAAVFPLFFWLPASYHTTSYSTSALFAGLLSKVGVYALIRLFTLVFVASFSFSHALILVLAILTLVVGIMGAITHFKLRQVFSFSLISHIGYMLLGLALMNLFALIGAIFYMLQHMLVKALLFMSSGLIKYYRANQTGPLYRTQPGLACVFFIAILALAGVPPFSGFWAKLLLIQGAINAHHAWLAILMLLISLLTLYVMIRLWHNVFFSTPEASDVVVDYRPRSMWVAVLILMTMVLLLSLLPNVGYSIAKHIALQLLHPNNYIAAVLRGG